jgi:hypothetical protein
VYGACFQVNLKAYRQDTKHDDASVGPWHKLKMISARAFFQSAHEAKDESELYDKIPYIMWSSNWIDSNDLQEPTRLRLFMRRKYCLHSLALTDGCSYINTEVVGIDDWL